MRHPYHLRIASAALAAAIALGGMPVSSYAAAVSEAAAVQSQETTQQSGSETTDTQSGSGTVEGTDALSGAEGIAAEGTAAGETGTAEAAPASGAAGQDGSTASGGTAAGTTADGASGTVSTQAGTEAAAGSSAVTTGESSTVSSEVSQIESYAQEEAAALTIEPEWESAVVLDDEDSEDGEEADVLRLSSSEEDEIIEKMTGTTVPESFEKETETGSNPLNIEKGAATVAIPQHELLLYENRITSGAPQNSMAIYDKYLNTSAPVASSEHKGGSSYKGAGITTNLGSYVSNFEKATKYSKGPTNSSYDLRYYSMVRAVACDPFGTGRDSCVAYVGLEARGSDTARVVTWLYDYKNDVCSEVIELSLLAWDSIGSTMYASEMENFMAITAGNYYGNRNETTKQMKDTVVVYVPSTSGRKWGLTELQWTQDAATHAITAASRTDADKTLMHPGFDYADWGDTSWAEDSNVRDKLGCSLATGDFNNDGYEDLVALTYVGNVKRLGKGDGTRYVPYLALSAGGGSQKVSQSSSGDGIYVEQKRGTIENGYLWDTNRSPGISVGDANGDGIDEIAVAGIKVTQALKGQDAHSALYNNDQWYYASEEDTLVVGIYGAPSGKLQIQSFNTEVKTNKWKKTGTYTGDTFLARSGVAFFALNGPGKAEALFIDGSVYQFQSGSCEIGSNPSYTPVYFTKNDKGAGRISLTNTYIQSVAVGNFDHNLAGREQVMFLVGLKTSGGYSDTMALLSIGGVYGNDVSKEDTASKVTTTDYQDSTGFYENGFDGNEYYVSYIESSNVNKWYSSELVALDMDEDGLQIEFEDVSYEETEPQVQAVIQAAPAFAGLKQYEMASSTSYKITGSYTYKDTRSWATSHSYGVTIQMMLSFPPVESVAQWNTTVRIGASTSDTQGESTSKSTTYTAAFSATNENLVVLRRNPYYRYSYKFTDDTGKTHMMYYSVGQAPIYLELSVEEYNKVIDRYNEIMRGKASTTYTPTLLVSITDPSLNGNYGNPWKYSSKLGGENIKEDYYITSEPSSKGHFSEKPSWIQLGYASGSTEVSLTDSEANEKFNSSTSNFNFAAESVAGNKYLMVGGYYSYSRGQTTGSSTTTGKAPESPRGSATSTRQRF